ncbi:MAG: TatD family hydrolase [Flavobacteriales bacterium]|jgi:TatD DNase family protein
MLTDTHCHLYQPAFDSDRRDAVARARAAGVSRILLPNIDVDSIPRMHALLDAEPGYCLGMMGLHPCHVASEGWEEAWGAIEAELRRGLTEGDRKYIAVGEIGLDLYWDKTTLPAQRAAFRAQTACARTLDLPIVIHVRDAFVELFEELALLDPAGGKDPLRGVIHCFTGGVAEAEQALAHPGLMLGIGGVATYKNGGLEAVIPGLPRDRVILETDAPYLAPVPFRGKRNEPAHVAVVAARVAELWDVPVDEVARVTSENACRLFRLPPL